MILLIDNYDSFTYNLYQYMGEFYKDIKVVRNDEITIDEIRALKPFAIVISPGPGEPRDAGICIDVIKSFYKELPILGICLGHQAIGEAFGGTIVRAKKVMHGKTSIIKHNSDGIYKCIENPVKVMRYHSLVIDKDTLNKDFEVSSFCEEDGEIMGIKHKDYKIYGIQFHPESIFTDKGKEMIGNFIDIIKS